MLQIRDIVKTYKSKSGVSVKALDGVSLTFDDTGLVFILGKSGSGKSTLLNVIGGLDRADSGEISVKGKSDADFTQADYDSYRNTYIGFIFQEYNLLGDFSVKDNIALAVELQGKKLTEDRLNALLAEVDLTGYGNRKPNELSGGQKQRVAIARALIKEPEIIMADEPTGALDNNTGIMVFDTLKKLSKSKLVIVVSHDREFAESFGDRVIEIADGKVIGDISKVKTVSETENGITKLGDSLLKIESGHKLTDSDIEKINAMVAEGELFISADGKINKELKKKSGLDDEGNREYFEDTKPSDKKEKGDCKFIRSRLPYGNALRMGLSNLKVKPFRLIITILLSAVAFSLLGLMLTLVTFDSTQTTYDSILDTGIDYLSLTKEVNTGDYSNDINLSASDLSYLSEKFPDVGFFPLYDTDATYYENVDKPSSVYSTGFVSFYNSTFAGLTELDAGALREYGFAIDGSLPTSDDEIAVTEYCFEQFKLGGYKSSDGDTFTVSAHKDLIGKKLLLQFGTENKEYTITGVIDTALDSEPYLEFMPGATPDQSDAAFYRKMAELDSLLTKSYHTVAFVNKGYIEKLNKQNASYVLNDSDYAAEIKYNDTPYYVMKLGDGEAVSEEIFYVNGKNTLGRGEVLVSTDFLNYITYTGGGGTVQFYELYSEYRDDILADNVHITNEELDRSVITRFIADYGRQIKQKITISTTRYDDKPGASLTATIAGVVFSKGIYETGGVYYFNKEDLEELSISKEEPYSAFVAKMPQAGSLLMNLVKFTRDDGIKETNYRMKNSVTSTMERVDSMFSLLSDIFLYCGIGCALFAALMLMNFISVSINAKRREIGILRAVGARGTDVLAVFFSESAIIALINFALSSAITGAVCAGLNGILRNDFSLPVTLLHFGAAELFLILGVSLVTAFIGSALPVFRLSKKRPVDTMRV